MIQQKNGVVGYKEISIWVWNRLRRRERPRTNFSPLPLRPLTRKLKILAAIHEDAAELYEKAANFTNLENPVSLSHFELWSLKLDCILSYRLEWRRMCLEIIQFHCQPGTLVGSSPALSSDPLVTKDAVGYSVSSGNRSAKPLSVHIVEIDVPNSANHEGNFLRNPTSGVPGATTRKSALQVERQNSEVSYYADDEDANRKKYTRRGGFGHKFLRACLATMGILYYRIAQRGFREEDVVAREEEQ
ncbi:hypothetical protein L6452_05448 [Arctium lappa]|uniref:Uncharacterized protein n=1 Tax=Arctium lappa TaxID=4217 RepID=A0ACB9EG59_ARCLA|nr:hypothetical protein L6452_05448 [Arctium lappa]